MKYFKKVLPYLLIFLLGLSLNRVVDVALAHGGDTNLIHGCVRNITGLLRIVSPTTNCGGNETALDWSKDGIGDFGGFFTKQLPGIDLSGSKLGFRNFEGGVFVGAVFSDSDISNSNFKNVNLTNASMISVLAAYTDFSQANLQNANMYEAFLSVAKFDNANLTNTDFTRAVLQDATGLDTAIRTGTIWSNTVCPDNTNSDDNGNTCEGHLVP